MPQGGVDEKNSSFRTGSAVSAVLRSGVRDSAFRGAHLARRGDQPFDPRKPDHRRRPHRGGEPRDVRRHRLLHGLHSRLHRPHLLHDIAAPHNRRTRQRMRQSGISRPGHQLSVERRMARSGRRDRPFLRQFDHRHRRHLRRRGDVVGVLQHRLQLRTGVRRVGDRPRMHADAAFHDGDQRPRHGGVALRHGLRRTGSTSSSSRAAKTATKLSASLCSSTAG